LPVLNTLGGRYEERGVVVLAVNAAQSEAQYREFIEASGYAHLTWIRDAHGEVLRRYQVRNLPTTYLLDGQGVVRRALVGYRRDREQVLTEEIESLLQ
jgi:peroxiredoxin